MIANSDNYEFQILGPVQVIMAGRPAVFVRRQQLDLLAFLLLRAGHVATLAEMVDAMWGEAVPRTANNQIRNLLSGLRGALTDGTGTLATVDRHRAGYQLSIADGHLDLATFTALVGQARHAAAPDKAARLLRQALGLWRGTLALAGVRAPFAATAQAHLAEHRAAAQEALFDAELDSGGHAKIVAELTDAVADSPGRERFVAQLMIALYRSGRTADSLAVYRRARQTLTEEYGLEPGRALRDLERLVLLGDQALAMPGQRPATAPEPIGSNGGGLVNGQRVDPRDGAPGIHHDAGSATVRVRPAPLPVPAQLPLQPRGFIGRAAELARLDGLLAARAESPTATVVCALSGTAGVGKTTLAVHWAHRVADQFPDGQLYVDLRGFGPGGAPVEPEAAIRGFLDALAVPVERVPADQDAQAALYRSVLAGRRMLVVLDNARDTAQVRPLLPGSSTTMVLVTSRDKLAGLVAGVGAAPLVLDVLSTAEAKELVAARVDAGRVEAAPDAVTDIVALCARLPLTLAIAAGRAASRPALPLDALAAELRDAHHRLDAFDTGDAGTDVRGVFSWSYQRLGPDAARLFRLLGLHPGRDLTVAAAASLFGVAPRLVRPLVAELTRASLLTELTIGRYTCHDLLRAYAVELASMVDLADDRRAAVTRLLDGYVAAARNAMDALSPADPAESNGRRRLPASASASAEQFRSPAEARAWLDAELPNLLALATHAAREGWPAQAAQLSDILALEKARHDCPGGPTAKHLPATVTHPPATVTHLPAERRSTWVNMKALMIVDSERRTAGGETGLVVCCDDGVAPSDKCPASGGWGTVPRAQ